MLQENEILLKCRNLTLKRKGFTLDSVDFELPKGYILGIMGRNGVGKSTLVQALLGICQKEEQERIFFQGTPIKDIVSYKKNLAYGPLFYLLLYSIGKFAGVKKLSFIAFGRFHTAPVLDGIFFVLLCVQTVKICRGKVRQ